MKSEKDSEKKPLSIKDFGLPKIIALMIAGIVILYCSIPEGFFGGSNNTPKKLGVKEDQSVSSQTDETCKYLDEMERRLEVILKKVDGIGQVEVMITAKGSKEKVTLKDSPFTQDSTSETDAQGGTRTGSNVHREEETVMMQSGSGATSPYVIKELEPDIEGVLVIAQGAKDAKIISEINSAIQVLFDVPAHKIKVMKMI